MDCRGFQDVEAMNAHMIQKWNAKVRKNDEVVILGDFSYGNAQETESVLQKINGRLFLIEGNHDPRSTTKNPRFEWVLPYKELHDNGRKVILSHYPIFCYNGQYRVSDAGNPLSYMLYGHVHDSFDQRLLEQFQKITRAQKREVFGADGLHSIPCNLINCFCKYADYEPLSLDEWIENDRKRAENLPEMTF